MLAKHDRGRGRDRPQRQQRNQRRPTGGDDHQRGNPVTFHQDRIGEQQNAGQDGQACLCAPQGHNGDDGHGRTFDAVVAGRGCQPGERQGQPRQHQRIGQAAVHVDRGQEDRLQHVDQARQPGGQVAQHGPQPGIHGAAANDKGEYKGEPHSRRLVEPKDDPRLRQQIGGTAGPTPQVRRNANVGDRRRLPHVKDGHKALQRLPDSPDRGRAPRRKCPAAARRRAPAATL